MIKKYEVIVKHEGKIREYNFPYNTNKFSINNIIDEIYREIKEKEREVLESNK